MTIVNDADIVRLMNEIQEKLIALSREQDISILSLRQIARLVEVKNPQTIKYHLKRLYESGSLEVKRRRASVEKNKLGSSDLISIPILGYANAGPATFFANDDVEGYLRISSSLLRSRNYNELFALKIFGNSMIKANIDGSAVNDIDDGDYAVIDSSKKNPKNGDYVIAVVNNLANIKRYYFDVRNSQIVLMSESTDDFLPIFIHPDDNCEGLISGIVSQIIKRPLVQPNHL